MSYQTPSAQVGRLHGVITKRLGRHRALVAAMLTSASVGLAGCVSTTSTDPSFGKQQQEPSTGAKIAGALSPTAIGKSVSKTFRSGSEKVTATFKTKPSEEPTREATVAWWPFKKEEAPGADFYVSLARVHEQSGGVDQAVAQYTKALSIEHDHAGALVGYAHLLDRQGQKVKATEYYLRAVKAHPEDASIANDLGLCYARQGKLDLAVEYIGKAVKLQPDRELYRNNIATVLVEVGRVNEAVAQVASVYGEPIAHYNVGVLLKQQGKRQEAIDQFTLAVTQDPGMDQAREWLDRMNAEREPRAQIASAEMGGSSAGPVSYATTRAMSTDSGESSIRVRSPAHVASRAPGAVGAPGAGDANGPGIPPSPDQVQKFAPTSVSPAALRSMPAAQTNYVPPNRY